MVCQRCKKSGATVHLTEIADTTRRELHLCDTCARALGVMQNVQAITLTDILQQLVDPKMRKQVKEFQNLACPTCGTTYADLRSRGRLGCAQDLEVFEVALVPLLERIHHATHHLGRMVSSAPPDAGLAQELALLRRQLEEMKKKEDFERCAQLRDRIRQLERQMGLPEEA